MNGRLRERLAALGDRQGFDVRFPEKVLCSDNAAVIAACGVERYRRFGATALSRTAVSREAL